MTSDTLPDELPPEGDELAELRWHWDSAYLIHCRDGEWTALFRDDLTTLTASSADGLRQLIWDDYTKRKSLALSDDDLDRILLTSAHPALRFTIGTHGVHLARWRHRRKRPDEPQDGPPSSESPSP